MIARVMLTVAKLLAGILMPVRSRKMLQAKKTLWSFTVGIGHWVDIPNS
jgi:hypothetical protein